MADLLGKSVSPERDGQKVMKSKAEIQGFLSNNKVAKYHHGTPESILTGLVPHTYKIVGMVRNPRDRGVSRAFHDFYHKKHDYQVKRVATTDFEAVRWIVLESVPFIPDNQRQANELMLYGYSTRNKLYTDLPYIWTSYEWMLEDTLREVTAILQFLGVKATKGYTQIVDSHSFKKKSGRDAGEESRHDTWRRKGQMLDWINWYNEEMLSLTADVQERYWRQLVINGGR
jgi:hypothetical protein